LLDTSGEIEAQQKACDESKQKVSQETLLAFPDYEK
jgi:hypothetical protein